MKRKITIIALSAAMAVMMLVAAVLPMHTFAAEETLSGLAFTDRYYQSSWVGSSIKAASYASWVATDGSWNGAWQWGNEYNKVSLDSEKGVLTFKETNGLSLKFHPGQISNNPLGEGAAYCSVDIYYESGTYMKDGFAAPRFPGLTFDLNKTYPLFSIDSAGNFYAGEKPTNAGASPVGKLMDGWNTVAFILLPLDDAGKLVETTNGENNLWASDWPIKRIDGYVRLSNASAPAAESRAFTTADLKRDWNYVPNLPCQKSFYCNLGADCYLKPLIDKCGQFSLANAMAVNLIPNQEIYQYTYHNGDGKTITQAVPAAAANKEVVVPAGVKTDATPVKSWYNAALDKYLKPGDKVVVSSSAVFDIATGTNELIGTLGAAIDRVRADLSTYTYAELQGEIDNIEAAARAANLDATHAYTIKKENKINELKTRMANVKSACELVIEKANVMVNEELPFAERVAAYNACHARAGELDATYSADAAAAIEKMIVFETSWTSVSELYTTYIGLAEIVDGSPAGYTKNLIYRQLFESFNQVADSFPTFVIDAAHITGFENNMEASLTQLTQTKTIGETYTRLKEWAGAWNAFCRAKNVNRAETPAPLKEAVAFYNNMVYAVNREIAEAITVGVVTGYTSETAAMRGALLADVHSKVQSLFDNAQEED